MKTLLMCLTTIVLLSGCATFGDTFDNRITCTVAKDAAFVVSQYGTIGIASSISAKDTVVICK